MRSLVAGMLLAVATWGCDDGVGLIKAQSTQGGEGGAGGSAPATSTGGTETGGSEVASAGVVVGGSGAGGGSASGGYVAVGCEPNRQVECPCPDGSTALQTCATDGSEWSVCSCPPTSCDSPLTLCDGECVDTNHSWWNCGECGRECGDSYCYLGNCVLTCPAGLYNCGNTCYEGGCP